MDISITRLFTKDKLIDQLTGLAFGVGVAVLTIFVGSISSASNADLWDKAFWITTTATAVRSGVTAIGTVLGLTIPGVSSK